DLIVAHQSHVSESVLFAGLATAGHPPPVEIIRDDGHGPPSTARVPWAPEFETLILFIGGERSPIAVGPQMRREWPVLVADAGKALVEVGQYTQVIRSHATSADVACPRNVYRCECEE